MELIRKLAIYLLPFIFLYITINLYKYMYEKFIHNLFDLLKIKKVENKNIVLNECNQLIKNGKLEASLKILSNLIKDYPKEPEAYHKRGFVYLNLKQYQNAIQDYQKSFTLDSEIPDIEKDIAYAYMQAENFEKAIEYFHLAYEKNSREKEIINLINSCKQKQKNYYSENFAEHLKVTQLSPLVFYAEGESTSFRNKFRLAFEKLNDPLKKYRP